LINLLHCSFARRAWARVLLKTERAGFMEFLHNEIHDQNGLAAVSALLVKDCLSDEELLVKREEIRRCQTLLKRAQRFCPSVEFSPEVMGLIRALDKAEARESARMLAVAA
jgi:hypothetical protein